MLLIALIVAFWIQRGAVDITSMITGNQPPSKTYRKATGDTAEDGPLGKFVKAWWADALEDADERRRYARTKKKEGEQEARARQEQERAKRKAERQKVLDRIEEEARRAEKDRASQHKPESIPVPEPPAPEEADRTIPDIPDLEDEPGVDPFHVDLPFTIDEDAEPAPPVDMEKPPQPQEAGPPEMPGFPAGPKGPVLPELTIIAGGKTPADDEEWRPYGRPPLYAVTDKEEGEMTALKDLIPGGGGDGTDESAKAMQGNVDAVNRVQGQNDDHKNTTVQAYGTNTGAGASMTSNGQNGQSAAVEGGLSTHILWTEETAKYQNQAKTYVEIVGAQMQQGDNGPERLARIARIMEMHNALHREYMALNGDLRQDMNVAEAYRAGNNQAGSKQYVNK